MRSILKLCSSCYQSRYFSLNIPSKLFCILKNRECEDDEAFSCRNYLKGRSDFGVVAEVRKND